MQRTFQAFFLAAAIGTAAFAQTSTATADPATLAQRKVSRLAAQLNLTEAQKSQATTIFTNAFTAAQPIHSSLQANRTAMQTAIQKNDAATIDLLSNQSGPLAAQLMDINAKANAAFYNILTPAQQAAYNSMPHGWGAPGGPRGRMHGPTGE